MAARARRMALGAKPPNPRCSKQKRTPAGVRFMFALVFHIVLEEVLTVALLIFEAAAAHTYK